MMSIHFRVWTGSEANATRAALQCRRAPAFCHNTAKRANKRAVNNTFPTT
jgi:hypothetical protein